MKTKLGKLALAFVLAVLIAPMLLAQSGTAQNRPAAALSVAPPPTATHSLPRPDFHFPGNVGRTYLDSDPPIFPQPVQAPKGAPNIVLILIDDAGFGQF